MMDHDALSSAQMINMNEQTCNENRSKKTNTRTVPARLSDGPLLYTCTMFIIFIAIAVLLSVRCSLPTTTNATATNFKPSVGTRNVQHTKSAVSMNVSCSLPTTINVTASSTTSFKPPVVTQKVDHLKDVYGQYECLEIFADGWKDQDQWHMQNEGSQPNFFNNFGCSNWQGYFQKKKTNGTKTKTNATPPATTATTTTTTTTTHDDNKDKQEFGIFLKDNKNVRVQICQSTSLETLEEMIHDEKGCLSDQYWLSCNGKPLLAPLSGRLQCDDTIHINFRGSGGGKKGSNKKKVKKKQ